ncbi:hypothetical protein RRG08_027146 [Elysia crispata]|uniref:Uncharacterized protein n=1 Tax=Elysia crispata TaxID=231223 RepID=A0AAE1D567_9GAST|nr:hypothetical protein RRG08_027146 [Elysia crispata]
MWMLGKLVTLGTETAVMTEASDRTVVSALHHALAIKSRRGPSDCEVGFPLLSPPSFDRSLRLHETNETQEPSKIQCTAVEGCSN